VKPVPVPRRTRQREAIREAIASADGPLSAREILLLAKRHTPGLGLATVYRAIRQLAEEGVVAQVEIPGQSPRYEPAGRRHHHHFHCRACGRVYEVEGCCGHFEKAAPRGFRIEGHDVILYGRCATCVRGEDRTSRGRTRTGS
jgi:Fur family ferric uptake transcriptional regulator